MLVRSWWFMAYAARQKEVGPSRSFDGQTYEIAWEPEPAARHHWEVPERVQNKSSHLRTPQIHLEA